MKDMSGLRGDDRPTCPLYSNIGSSLRGVIEHRAFISEAPSSRRLLSSVNICVSDSGSLTSNSSLSFNVNQMVGGPKGMLKQLDYKGTNTWKKSWTDATAPSRTATCKAQIIGASNSISNGGKVELVMKDSRAGCSTQVGTAVQIMKASSKITSNVALQRRQFSASSAVEWDPAACMTKSYSVSAVVAPPMEAVLPETTCSIGAMVGDNKWASVACIEYRKHNKLLFEVKKSEYCLFVDSDRLLGKRTSAAAGVKVPSNSRKDAVFTCALLHKLTSSSSTKAFAAIRGSSDGSAQLSACLPLASGVSLTAAAHSTTSSWWPKFKFSVDISGPQQKTKHKNERKDQSSQ